VDLGRARRALERELREYGYEDVRVEFEVVDRLAPDPATGKYRRMVPLARGGVREPAGLVRTGAA
jgi:hypothetical protein